MREFATAACIVAVVVIVTGFAVNLAVPQKAAPVSVRTIAVVPTQVVVAAPSPTMPPYTSRYYRSIADAQSDLPFTILVPFEATANAILRDVEVRHNPRTGATGVMLYYRIGAAWYFSLWQGNDNWQLRAVPPQAIPAAKRLNNQIVYIQDEPLSYAFYWSDRQRAFLFESATYNIPQTYAFRIAESIE